MVGQHLRSHAARDNFLARDTRLRKIYVEYQDLKYYGYNARYEMSKFTPTDVAGAAATFAVVKSYIYQFL